MFQWLKKKPEPAPVQAAPPSRGSGSIGVNLPADSPAMKLRCVSRLIRVRQAQAKAAKAGDAERVESLENSRQKERMKLIAAGVDVPPTIEGLEVLQRELQQIVHPGG